MFLRAMFYYLLHNPSTLKRLMAEFDAAAEAGNLDELAGFRQAKDLPYFNACINEAGRMHPPLGLPMERVIPAEGANICGQRLEGGTVVGMSSWVTHHHEQTFGADCDKWRPERWLCEPEQAKYMEKCLLTVSRILSTFFARHQPSAYPISSLVLAIAIVSARILLCWKFIRSCRHY